MTFLLVVVAGAAGAVARFVIDGAVKLRWASAFPWPTVGINVSGSLLLGLLTGMVLAHSAPEDLKLIIGTGFCGGYTTFSTASFETVRLLQQRRLWLAGFACLGTLYATLGAGALGLLIGQR